MRDSRVVNQVANYALVEWHDNIDIRDQPPSEYAPTYEARFSEAELAEMYELHGLPWEWYRMTYQDFLAQRCKRMAGIIHKGVEYLKRQTG